MIYGRVSSPYNYGYKIELIEPLRAIGCGQYALDAYNNLEVKHVQVHFNSNYI
jgi:hypothetical protein